MSVDVLLDAVKLIGESLASVLALHGEHVLKGLLFTAEDLNFLLVGI